MTNLRYRPVVVEYAGVRWKLIGESEGEKTEWELYEGEVEDVSAVADFLWEHFADKIIERAEEVG